MTTCPKCGASHYSMGSVMTTLVYYPPVYKDGVNVNPDRNTMTRNLTCMECGHGWAADINPNNADSAGIA